MTGPLYLAEDVYFCVTEEQGVFLDLRRDMYSAVAIPARIGDSLACLSHSALVEALASQRRTLLENELVTETGPPGSPLDAFLAIERRRSHIFHPDDQRAFGLTGEAAKEVRVRAADVLDFLVASWRASRRLRTRHIRDVVHAVRRRKAGGIVRDGAVEDLRRATAVFRRLRPWYPRSYLCLFDSLALIEFLAQRRLYPLWVFGVQAQPFAAHCWVQADGCVLNESTEYAGQFTPILAI